MLKEGKKEKIIGIVILLVVIASVIGIKLYMDSKSDKNLTTIYGAVGGGKEDFLADEDFNKILKDKYKIKFVGDSWGNGSTIKLPLVRETVKPELATVSESEYSIKNSACHKYDLLFTSDERYLSYYRTSPQSGEADRYRVLKGSLTLNTPIVFYSWDTVVDALIKEKIVEEKNGVYYMTDTMKLINYMLQGKNWTDIGLDLFGKISVVSVDPVQSSPGATYYGLLLTILTNGSEREEDIEKALPTLRKIYKDIGFLGITPADNFENFSKIGKNTYPIIVDYEKSLMEFKNRDEDGYNQIKDSLRIIYTIPTVTNSHCIATFTDNGNKFMDAFNDKDIQKIAWSKYGFRVGATGGSTKVEDTGIKGIPQELPTGAKGLQMDTYNRLIEYLKEGV